MGKTKTITIRVSNEQAAWLERTAKASGRPRGQIVRDQIEQARVARRDRPWMRLAGIVDGAPDLSQRKGFTRR